MWFSKSLYGIISLSHSGNGQLKVHESNICSATRLTDDDEYGLFIFPHFGQVEIPLAKQVLQINKFEHMVQFKVPTATYSHLEQVGTILWKSSNDSPEYS